MEKPKRKDENSKDMDYSECAGYNQAYDDWEKYHNSEMKRVLLIAKDLLTWCIEPDKKQIIGERLETISKELKG